MQDGQPPQADDEARANAIAANSVEFTEDQRDAVRDAVFDAQIALLKGIAQQAGNLTNFEAVRNLGGLVGALQGIRGMTGQTPQALWSVTHGGPRGWVGYAPNTGEVFDPDFDED